MEEYSGHPLSSHDVCTCRSLVRRANRRVVRKKRVGRLRNSSQHADVAFHPQLSMAHGEPHACMQVIPACMIVGNWKCF